MRRYKNDHGLLSEKIYGKRKYSHLALSAPATPFIILFRNGLLHSSKNYLAKIDRASGVCVLKSVIYRAERITVIIGGQNCLLFSLYFKNI